MHELDGGREARQVPNSPAASLESGALADAPGHVAAATTWVSANVRDIVIVLSLGALCLMHRIETLDPVNTGGDAAIKWQFVREWFYAHDFAHAEWNHHMTRFGVLVPAYIAQRFMGHGLRGYYTAPLAACVVQVLFVYGCGKRLSGRLAGALGAFLLIYTRVMATAGSQLLPDLFTGTYGIVMMYTYLRYADARGSTRLEWLVVTALVAFVGYLAKETMAFFFPGMALAIWLAGRAAHGSSKGAARELAIFFGLLLLGLLLETVAYRAFTEYHSRLAIVFHSHVDPSGDAEGRADTTFWKLFDRYEHIDKPWVWAFDIFLPCWLAVLAFMRNYRVRAMLGVVASFFFFLTFLVRSISPMLLWHRFMSRYLDPTAPFVELVTALFLVLVLQQFWEQRGASRVWQWLARFERHSAALVFSVSALLGIWSYSNLQQDLPNHAYTQATELATRANDAYRRNLPIVIRRARAGNQFYARDVQTLYAVYMDVRPLLRNGKLPRFDEAKRVTGSFTYLVRDPAKYTTPKVTRLLDAGCALEVRETTPTMVATPLAPLPASCDALAAN
jgi:hypothetical protein